MSSISKTMAWLVMIAVALFAVACAGEQAEPEVIIKEVVKEVPVEVEKVVEVGRGRESRRSGSGQGGRGHRHGGSRTRNE